MKNRLIYRTESAILVFRKGKTTNKKIASPDENIVQTYSFSIDQYEYIRNQDKTFKKINPKQFFDLASSVCFDCPFIGYGKCYTHKYMQFSGFISMLRSVFNEVGTVENIPYLSEGLSTQIVNLSKGLFIRFGTYGEPSLIDINLVDSISKVVKNWTGYSHQYARKPEYLNYFMASIHSIVQADKLSVKGLRGFLVNDKGTIDHDLIVCPASNEAGFKSNCSKCGLCSGTFGKGKKSIIINEH